MTETKIEDIGSYKVVDGEYEFEKDYYSQGWIFKSWENYRNNKGLPCYSSEYSDNDYWTADDFLAIAGGNEAIADQLFDEVDWQCPETLFEEWLMSGLVVEYGGTYKFDDEVEE